PLQAAAAGQAFELPFDGAGERIAVEKLGCLRALDLRADRLGRSVAEVHAHRLRGRLEHVLDRGARSKALEDAALACAAAAVARDRRHPVGALARAEHI